MKQEFKFLKLKKTKEGYEYAERKGKDSIAFILVKTENKLKFVGLRHEYKPPVGAWVLGAFGGSLDKRISPMQTCIEEVREEAGFEVIPDTVKLVGRYLVSSQMNQYCYLYVVDVTNAKWAGLKPEDHLESISDFHWFPDHMRPKTECWKSAILLRSL